MKEEKIIMYDSPEAATYKTGIEGWVSATGRFWGKDEHMARYDGCTHQRCECGNEMSRGWTKCDECRRISARERFEKLPYKEWDCKEPVCTSDGDTYFFDVEDLEEYMNDCEIDEIDLLICDPIFHRQLDSEYFAENAHENYETPVKLEKAIEKINAVIKKLPPHSWQPGKIRTNYKSQSND